MRITITGRRLTLLAALVLGGVAAPLAYATIGNVANTNAATEPTKILAPVVQAGPAASAAAAAAAKTYPLGWHERYFGSGGEFDIAVVVRSLEISSASWRVRLSVTNHSSLGVDVRPRFALIGDRAYRGRLVGANPAPIATGESWPLLVVEGRGRPSGRLRFKLGAFFYPLIPGLPEIAWLSRRSVGVR